MNWLTWEVFDAYTLLVHYGWTYNGVGCQTNMVSYTPHFAHQHKTVSVAVTENFEKVITDL